MPSNKIFNISPTTVSKSPAMPYIGSDNRGGLCGDNVEWRQDAQAGIGINHPSIIHGGSSLSLNPHTIENGRHIRRCASDRCNMNIESVVFIENLSLCSHCKGIS